MSSSVVGILSILAFDVLVGFSPIATKFINVTMPGVLLVAIRFGIASVFLFLFILMSAKWKKSILAVTKYQLFGLVTLGILGSGVASWLHVIAVRKIGAALATILTNLEIPLGILFAVWLLGEKVNRRFLVAALYILVGVYLVTWRADIGVFQWGSGFWIGIAASFLAAIIWGGCTVLGKVLLKNLTPTAVAFYRFTVATLFNSLIFFVIYSGRTAEFLQTISHTDWLKLLYLGVGVSGIGLLLYYKALHFMEVKEVSLLATLPIVLSVLLGVATGETLLLHQWVGAFVIVSGIAVVVSWGKDGETLI